MWTSWVSGWEHHRPLVEPLLLLLQVKAQTFDVVCSYFGAVLVLLSTTLVLYVVENLNHFDLDFRFHDIFHHPDNKEVLYSNVLSNC